jgi:hypothetical protein
MTWPKSAAEAKWPAWPISARHRLFSPVDDTTPIVAFQRQWMQTIASNAMEKLRADHAKRGSKSCSPLSHLHHWWR